jgi:RNA polymerase primary sigma factor
MGVIECKKTTSRVNDFEGEETLASLDIEDDPMLEIVEPESEELQSTEDTEDEEEEQQIPNEEFRLLYAYLKDMANEPLLTPKEEIEISTGIKKCETKIREIEALFDKLSNEGAIKDKRKDLSKRIKRLNASMKAYLERARELKGRFIKANLRLVVSVARRYTSRGLPFPDLIQEGNIGLMKAVEKFDHTKGFKFSTYASWWVQQAILRAIMDQTGTIRVPVYVFEQAGEIRRISSMLHKEMGRKPMPEEIARKSGIPVEGVRRILEEANYIFSLDSPIVDGEPKTFLDFIPDKLSLSDSVVAKAALKETIRDALSMLTPREREVIRMRFGIDQEIPHTLDEIGRKYGRTRERIRQIEKGALKKLAASEIGKILKSFC